MYCDIEQYDLTKNFVSNLFYFLSEYICNYLCNRVYKFLGNRVLFILIFALRSSIVNNDSKVCPFFT